MCTFRGTYAFNASSSVGLCGQPTTINVYSSAFTVGSDLYSDAGCTNEIATGYYCNSQYYFEYVGEGPGITAITTNCSSVYCVFDTAGNDDTFYSAGTYDGNFYYTGVTSGNFIYYSTGDTLWCLSASLGGTCLQFGPLGSTAPCPDLDDTLFTSGVCVTTTTTTDPCTTFDFDALFDCDVTITPSDTPTPTPTPTPTLTPTGTNVCGGANFDVTATKFTPTPAATSTPTPTPTSSTSYSCIFSGTVTFNSMSEVIACGDSKQFRDCFSGYDYYTTQALVDEFGDPLKEGYVYSIGVNNIGACVIFVGTVTNITGIDNVSIYQTIGPESAGSCLLCVPVASATPTMTPTNTPTPTPTLPCLCNNYLVTPDPSEGSFSITDCETGLTKLLSPLNFGLTSWSGPVAVCSLTLPNSIGTVTPNGNCCVPTYCNIWTTTNTTPIAVTFYYRNLSGVTITQSINPGQTVSVNSIVNPYQNSGTLVFTNTGLSCIPNISPTPTSTITPTPTPTPSNPPCVFSMTIDTTITNGTSTSSNRFKLPNTPYWSSVIVDWGDGVIQTLGSGSHPAHIYPTGGVYQIKMHPNTGGSLVGLNFSLNSNDEIKILSIDSWCSFIPAEDDSLYGAINLNLPSTSGVPNIPGAIAAGSIPVGGVWNFFEGTLCTQLNNVGSWDISDLSIMSWGSGGGPVSGIDLIPSNYNSLLIGWASLGSSLQSGVLFDAGNSQYNSSASSARNYLVTTKGWIISDGGLI